MFTPFHLPANLFKKSAFSYQKTRYIHFTLTQILNKMFTPEAKPTPTQGK